ncbi:hypothetical protein UZ36_07435 [Candidatus Nitromaritima sp. SCGC AAA799-C22]|nr:hypothetical protein UZ36_07435 [Candidatus Nitromaritima sp. SCGC AAA799-C22]
MDFRYRLAKKTFKNKKVPQKRATGMDNISLDQRGNDSSPEISPLSLDKNTITPKPKPPEKEKEISRRNLFSFGRMMGFAESIEEKPADDTAEDSVEEEREESSEAVEEAGTDAEEMGEESPAEKKGFFKRLIARFKPEELEQTEEPAADPIGTQESDEDESPAPTVTAQVEEIRADREEKAVEEDDDVDPAYDRRGLIKQGVHFFAKPAVESVQKKIDKVNETVDKFTKRVPLIRPPGASTERRFLQDCTRCDKCIHACPKDAIVKAPKKFGFLVMGTPYIDPKKNPCVMCDDLPCISACPDGALLPVESPANVKMGYAILDKKKCQAYGAAFCQQCVIDCPIPGAITQDKDNQPVFHKKICTGCGVCVSSCGTVNIPVAVKIKPRMVIEHQIRKKKLEEEQALFEAEKLKHEKLALEEEQRAQAQEAGITPEPTEE